LIQLLARFYDPDSGAVFLDDHYIRDIDLEVIRSSVATSQQEVFLFSDTVFGNIAYGSPKATMEEVKYWQSKGKKINEHFANHCYLEFEDGGLTWVLDTTDGLIYEKHLYQLINRPKVNCVRTKEETLAFPDYIDIVGADINRDKYIVPTLLPIIEAEIERESLYQEQARREIALFKEKVGYEELVQEIEENKKRIFGVQ
jgi:hypothetical protein